MASTYLKRTNGTPTNAQKGTFSAWVKRSKIGGAQRILTNFLDGNNLSYLRMHSDNYIQHYGYLSGSAVSHFKASRLLRDTSAWYHIMLVVDTTQGTASDRVKIYVNGEQLTSFSQADYPNQNITYPMFIASGSNYHTVGSAENGTDCWDGVMSHVHFSDGYALAPTVFGSTDSTTGEWKINTSPSVTYGTNGFFILKDGNSVTDQSGNGNNFTVGGGTLTNTEDCPSNVFATWNPNLAMNSTMTLANGNTTGTTGSNYAAGASNSWFSTLGMSSGKYYAEFKYVSSTTNDGSFIGVGYDLSKQQQGSSTNAYNFCQSIPEGYGYAPQGEVFNNGSTSGYSTYTTGDIIGVAIDCDNNTLNFYKNGASAGSQINITADKEYFFALSDGTSANTFTYSANFGNGYFGTTAVSSAGTNASGNGIFEYDVPTGYTALSTKGLNE